jgi:molybdopterin-binding protein
MRVEAVEQRGSTSRVSLTRNGTRLAASISRASAFELGLEPGAEVIAVFKATSVRVGRVQSGSVGL